MNLLVKLIFECATNTEFVSFWQTNLYSGEKVFDWNLNPFKAGLRMGFDWMSVR